MAEARVQSVPTNAGHSLWASQRQQGTGLCVGIDPHYQRKGILNEAFYTSYTDSSSNVGEFALTIEILAQTLDDPELKAWKGTDRARTVNFLVGLSSYFFSVIDAALAEGIVVFKPQVAFFERLGPLGMVILQAICTRLHNYGKKNGRLIFLILDCKRGDILSTQVPYYEAYLSRPDQEVIPGMGGLYDFNTMTVTAWMGRDVLTPGLPFFKDGKGAIVVTRSSNPSGATMQDTGLLGSLGDEPASPFSVTQQTIAEIKEIIGVPLPPTGHQVMQYLTTRFSSENNLDQDGISSIFSVMGSTVVMDNSFRRLRPGAVALIPGFGAQGGKFANIMSLAITEGPLEGHLGILASSRGHNYPWMTEAGGSGKPEDLAGEMHRVVNAFRKAEREAYAAYSLHYPF